MDIPVLNVGGDLEHLIFERRGAAVRVLHQGTLIAEAPVRDLADHLAGATTYRWSRHQLRWGELGVVLTRRRRVVLSVRGRIGPNTLTADELHDLWALLRKDTNPLTPGRVCAPRGSAAPAQAPGRVTVTY